MSNFNVHYLEDANFKVAISEIEGFINHYYRWIFMSASGSELPEGKSSGSSKPSAGLVR